MENARSRLEAALKSSNLDLERALYDLAIALKSEGMDQVSMARLYYEYFLRHRDDTDETVYDELTNILELIDSGAWAKGNGIFETELPAGWWDRDPNISN